MREKNRQLREENEALKKRVPAEGAVVLSTEDAKAWEAFAALKLKPEDVSQAIKERDEATGKLKELSRNEQLRAAARAMGLNADALFTLLNLSQVIIKDAAEGEKMVKRAFVKTEAGEQVYRTTANGSARWYAWGFSSSAAEISTPTTSAPRRASSRVTRPCPQARSSNRRPDA